MRLIRISFYYALRASTKLGLYFYFRKIKVSGLENIPETGPIIFGANHENAFMDALLIATHTRRYCHYLVRADIFKLKIVRQLLSLINMMPVYRIRDGFQSLKSNTDIFYNCYKLLNKGDSLIMFPEGNHDIRRVERTITKGISRIALGAVNEKLYPASPVIIPVGLNYSAHRSFRGDVHVVFGEPVYVEKVEANAQNLEKLRFEINSNLNKCHIRLPKEHYDLTYARWIKMSHNTVLNQPSSINQKIGDFLNRSDQSELESQGSNANAMLESIKYFRTSYSGIHKNWVRSIIESIIAVPFIIYGFINHFFTILILELVVKKFIRDHIFDTSIKFSIGYLLMTVSYVTQLSLVFHILNSPFWTLIYAITLPLSLILYKEGIKNIRSLMGKLKYERSKEWKEKFDSAKTSLLRVEV